MTEHCSNTDLGDCLSSVDASSTGSLLTKSCLQTFLQNVIAGLGGTGFSSRRFPYPTQSEPGSFGGCHIAYWLTPPSTS